ncbi:hypothetical protein HD600_001952 [Microbacterium ginsengiterrae]|uniref:Uncharacterized protein n=1 Tax=Microbacterium ginsengiterrae TaxID=546115 RepID=A0A7W9FBS0_9MICO|nr:hypothetical protein [Microbacterium ginsengiterrae]
MTIQSNPAPGNGSPPRREAPGRPPVRGVNAAPVLVKVPPPFSVRFSQFFWIISFTVGAFTLVYFFVIREDLLPLIAERAEKVTAGRGEATYESAADIIFWVVFALMIGVLLVQITLMVSFMSRRPHVRWWQLATLCLQVLLVLLSPEWVALGERGESIPPLLAAQAALVLLALFSSIMPRAIRWTARKHDVRRGPESPAGADF